MVKDEPESESMKSFSFKFTFAENLLLFFTYTFMNKLTVNGERHEHLTMWL